MNPNTRPYSLLRIIKTRFEMSDAELAELIGMSRPHVQAVISGAYAEYLNGRQMTAIQRYFELLRDQAVETLEELKILA